MNRTCLEFNRQILSWRWSSSWNGSNGPRPEWPEYKIWYSILVTLIYQLNINLCHVLWHATLPLVRVKLKFKTSKLIKHDFTYSGKIFCCSFRLFTRTHVHFHKLRSQPPCCICKGEVTYQHPLTPLPPPKVVKWTVLVHHQNE